MKFLKLQTLLNFFGSTQKKLEGFVWSILSITGLRSQRQFAPKCSFWQVALLYIVLSEYPDKTHNFYDVITLVLYAEPVRFGENSVYYTVIIRVPQRASML